ncbi:MAG: amidohydrolase family protein [Pricia sp.]
MGSFYLLKINHVRPMKITCILLALICICASCETNRKTIAVKEGLYISDAMILTSEDGQYTSFEGHVVVDCGILTYVGNKAPQITGDYEKIEGKGKFLIPGLIDSHVHIMQTNGMSYDHIQKNPELVSKYKEQVPRSYLYYGFTTLINLGGITSDYLDWLQSQPIRPDVYHTGWSGAAVANGYPMNNTPEQIRFNVFPNFIYLESEAENIPEQFTPEDHTAEMVVNRIKESGAIAVKTYYEKGWDKSQPELPVPSKSIIQNLHEQANKNGMVLTIHANSYEAHSFVTDAGVDIIAHGLWNWGLYSNAPKDSLPNAIQQVLDKQIEKQIGYTPTLAVINGLRVLADPDFLETEELKRTLSKEMIDWYTSEEGQWFAEEIVGQSSPKEVDSLFANIQSRGQSALKYVSDNGGTILFGTDTPSAPTYGNQPGFTGYSELVQMNESGLSLDKILTSATVNNAKAFHLDSIVGTIDVGKRAHLVLLNTNPLKTIEAYNDIHTVIVNGKAIPREGLSIQN